MHHLDVLDAARRLVADRGAAYGDMRVTMTRCANLASIRLDRRVTPYEVAIIMACMKAARLAHDRAHADSVPDLVNYEAFAASLVSEKTTEFNDVILAQAEADIDALVRTEVTAKKGKAA